MDAESCLRSGEPGQGEGGCPGVPWALLSLPSSAFTVLLAGRGGSVTGSIIGAVSQGATGVISH